MSSADLVQGRRLGVIRKLSGAPISVAFAGGFMALMLFVMVFAQVL